MRPQPWPVKPLNELQLRLLVEHLGEAVFMLDAAGRIENWTPAAMRVFGHQPLEMVDRPASPLYPGGAPELQACMSLALETGRAETEAWRLAQGGRRFWAREVICPILSDAGEAAGFAVIVRDQSELLRKDLALGEHARALERSNRELGEFASIASHDLQEPLRKILAFGDRLQTRCQGALEPKAAAYLGRILETSQRMRSLVDDLLRYSRVAASSDPPQRVDMNAVAREVLGDMEEALKRSGAELSVGELPVLMAEPGQMRQLLQNLVANALKFVPAGASPRVSLSSRPLPADRLGNPVWELSVADQGIGFDEKHLPKIFAMLSRLHNRSEYEGSGMGLAICRRIAERHGGGISARSRPGQGATFLVTLKSAPLGQALIA